MKYNFLFAVALLFSIQATAQLNLFGGAGFEVSYPNTFRAVGSQRSPEKNGYESVFFTSPDGVVEFYIFSPINILKPSSFQNFMIISIKDNFNRSF